MEGKVCLPSAILEFLRFVKVRVRRIIIRVMNAIFVCYPIQRNKIVFDNYRCKDYGCNPKYVAQKLIERGSGKYDLVWVISRENIEHNELPDQFRTVPYGSPASFWEYATAKLWVSNFHKVANVKYGLLKRKGQFFIQMWHGSLGIKKIDGDVSALRELKGWLPAAVKSSRMVDYWISNSSYETNVYKSAFFDVRDENILIYGHPRNDIFFDAVAMRNAYRKVAVRYGLEGRRFLLYAPTFREKCRKDGEIDRRTNGYNIDFSILLTHIRQRFGGEWVILIRQHPRLRDIEMDSIPSNADIIDVTHYADIQELLAASDCLVTDYSSCAFDFMLTRRPVFLFAADKDEFEKERGFYYPLENTPFPLACDNEGLMKNIDFFEEEAYLEKVKRFLEEKGCMEDGHASERVVDLIERLMGVKYNGGEERENRTYFI